MDSFLLYADSSTEGKKGYACRNDIIKDLNLDIVFRTMAAGDYFVMEKVRKIILLPLKRPEEIYYRHHVIQDFLYNDSLLEEIYNCALGQEQARQSYIAEVEKNRSRSTRKTGDILDTLEFLKNGHEALLYLRHLLQKSSGYLKSAGLLGLLSRMEAEPLDEIQEKLEEINHFVDGGKIGYTLQFGGGMKIRRATVNYSKSQNRIKDSQKGVLDKIYYKFIKKNSIPLRDEALQKDVSQMKEVAAGHLLKLFGAYHMELMLFWQHLAEELAFYKGVVRLMTRMQELSITLSMPEPLEEGNRQIYYKDLYELSMAIYSQKKPVGNTLQTGNNLLTVITGANQGGKSTFLRSFGIAQILMQCGMAVPAVRFSVAIHPQIFTHFSRREDEQLNSGRLREELKRMSSMIDAAVPNSLFLLNESFASTTEKEGSQIAGGILQAFYEKGISAIVVTHLFQLAAYLYERKLPGMVFLTAERQEDGVKTYHMLQGKPEHTSYGMDLFSALELEE